MSRPQFHHDKVNSQDEMDEQARKCLEIIGDFAGRTDNEVDFLGNMRRKAARPGRMYVTERSLNWLKDIKDEVIGR